MAKKNWFCEISGKGAIESLELFLKLSVVRGVPHETVLAEVMSRYNEEFIRENKLESTKLADENTTLAELRKAGLQVSRRTLWSYRTQEKLASANGHPCFWSDGPKRLVYNLGQVKSFFRSLQRN